MTGTAMTTRPAFSTASSSESTSRSMAPIFLAWRACERSRSAPTTSYVRSLRAVRFSPIEVPMRPVPIMAMRDFVVDMSSPMAVRLRGPVPNPADALDGVLATAQRRRIDSNWQRPPVGVRLAQDLRQRGYGEGV